MHLFSSPARRVAAVVSVSTMQPPVKRQRDEQAGLTHVYDHLGLHPVYWPQHANGVLKREGEFIAMLVARHQPLVAGAYADAIRLSDTKCKSYAALATACGPLYAPEEGGDARARLRVTALIASCARVTCLTSVPLYIGTTSTISEKCSRQCFTLVIRRVFRRLLQMMHRSTCEVTAVIEAAQVPTCLCQQEPPTHIGFHTGATRHKAHSRYQHGSGTM